MKKPSEKWLDDFRYNPIPPLLESGIRAIVLFAARDLLVERSIKTITNKPFGLSLSKASIGGQLAVRQAHRER